MAKDTQGGNGLRCATAIVCGFRSVASQLRAARAPNAVHTPADEGFLGQPAFDRAQVGLAFGLVIDALVFGRAARVVVGHRGPVVDRVHRPSNKRLRLKMLSGSKAFFSS